MKTQRRRIIALWLWGLGVLFLTQSGNAAAEPKNFKFEVTPYGAYRLGGDFEDTDSATELDVEESNAFGVMLNGSVPSGGQWEFLYAVQDTKVETGGLFGNDPIAGLDIEYIQLGGTYLFDGDDVRPFIAMTLGVSHFDPQPEDLGSESFFSASLGGGVQLLARQRLGVRLEGRVFSTFLTTDSNIFCRSDFGVGECLVQVSGNTFTQWEARAGLVFRF